MCTLTIYSGKKRCVVTMNRDELRTRRETGLIYSRSVNSGRLFYPVDISSGGTWFGVNNRGVILCLLNRYHAPAMSSAKSRGEIIPRALEEGSSTDVEAWLRKIPFADFNPFDLFLVAKKKVMRFSWNGSTYSAKDVEFKHWYMASSSAMSTEDVIAFRQSFFQAWSEEVGKKLANPDEILRGFHLIQIEGMETHSVLMEREKSHTKSVVQAAIDGRDMTLKYIPDVLEKILDSPLGNAQVETMEIRKG